MLSKNKDVLVIFVLQETKNPNLFEKNCTEDNAESWLSRHEEDTKKVDLVELVNYTQETVIERCYFKRCSAKFTKH